MKMRISPGANLSFVVDVDMEMRHRGTCADHLRTPSFYDDGYCCFFSWGVSELTSCCCVLQLSSAVVIWINVSFAMWT